MHVGVPPHTPPHAPVPQGPCWLGGMVAKILAFILIFAVGICHLFGIYVAYALLGPPAMVGICQKSHVFPPLLWLLGGCWKDAGQDSRR